MPTHARTPSPPSLPPREPESKKIGFVAPIVIFPSAKFKNQQNHKHVMETWYNQCHNKIKMKWYKY